MLGDGVPILNIQGGPGAKPSGKSLIDLTGFGNQLLLH